ncbi:MAG TPA: MBL fold metallo-hydrolase [Natronosporangium sp.]
MAGERRLAHVTEPVVAVADQLPAWVTLVRAPNPGPMTLDGTNTWVLRPAGSAPAVVVDPGPADEPHLRAVAEHGPIGAILVTHGHPDHVEGLPRFQELTGAEVVTEPAVAGLRITRIETPGHTADSVCYLAETGGGRAILTGDTILGRGTTIVAWPDGELGAYLASLERLRAFEGVPVLPGHGPPLTDCAAAAGFYLAHRRARLEQVRAAVDAGARTPEAIAAAVYPDVDQSLRSVAEWSIRAQLAYLDQERRESQPRREPLDSP